MRLRILVRDSAHGLIVNPLFRSATPRVTRLDPAELGCVVFGHERLGEIRDSVSTRPQLRDATEQIRLALHMPILLSDAYASVCGDVSLFKVLENAAIRGRLNLYAQASLPAAPA
jgi:hypothetical protein